MWLYLYTRAHTHTHRVFIHDLLKCMQLGYQTCVQEWDPFIFFFLIKCLCWLSSWLGWQHLNQSRTNATSSWFHLLQGKVAWAPGDRTTCLLKQTLGPLSLRFPWVPGLSQVLEATLWSLQVDGSLCYFPMEILGFHHTLKPTRRISREAPTTHTHTQYGTSTEVLVLGSLLPLTSVLVQKAFLASNLLVFLFLLESHFSHLLKNWV